MLTQLVNSNSALVEDDVREKAQAFVDEVHDRVITGVRVMLDDGAEIELDPDIAEVVQFVLHGLTQGGLDMRSVPDELTTTSAASMLGVSRPTLMKFLASGELASHKVGSHHRFAHRDVVAFLERRRSTQRRAFDALRALDEEIEAED